MNSNHQHDTQQCQNLISNELRIGQVQHNINSIKLGKYNLLYLNINSLFNKLEEIELILNQLGNIHFIALTEIRLHGEQNFAFNFNNYQAYFNNRNDGQGGVALYVHESLVSSLVLSDCTENINQLVVKINSLGISIAVLYRQPTANLSTFNRIYNALLAKHKSSIVVGDTNINLLNINNRITENYLNTTREHNFFVLNKIANNAPTRSATRMRNNEQSTSNTIIDHAISDLNGFDFILSLTDVAISDHKQMVLSFDDGAMNGINFSNDNINEVFTKIDAATFAAKLSVANWNEINNFENLTNCLQSIREDCKKTAIKRTIVNQYKPWLTVELLALINERNRYHKLLKKSPTILKPNSANCREIFVVGNVI